MSPSRPRRWLGLALAALCLAPTAGNVGSCGQEAVLLDADKFGAQKRGIDCSRCTTCGLSTTACEAACGEGRIEVVFPEGCAPLVHDGEVCLDALWAASCDEFEQYVADEGATIPTECDFCPLDEAGEPDRGGTP